MYKNIAIVVGYTLFYHGIYYCPVMNKYFEIIIKQIHGNYK